jgi:protein involved in sex pheromone biosynthesis
MRTISRIAFTLVLATTLIGTGCAEQKGKKEDKKADKKDDKQDAEKK